MNLELLKSDEISINQKTEDVIIIPTLEDTIKAKEAELDFALIDKK